MSDREDQVRAAAGIATVDADEKAERATAAPAAAGPRTAFERVQLARQPRRPGVAEAVDALITDFFEQRGDRSCADDRAIMGGVGLFHGRPVSILGHRRGATVDERVATNFGMPTPEGYRKAQRIMRAAQKFGRPLITFVDTPGAYPGVEAEAHGQGEAIARTIELMSSLTVPTVTVLMGEGGSGGALALAVGNRILMLENAVYSVLSPEGFASILWKDSARAAEAAEVMRLTAGDLLELGVIDAIVPEPAEGAHENPAATFQVLDTMLARELAALSKKRPAALARERYDKFREMGSSFIGRGRL